MRQMETSSQTQTAEIGPFDGSAPDREKESTDPSTDDGQVVALDNFRKK